MTDPLFRVYFLHYLERLREDIDNISYRMKCMYVSGVKVSKVAGLNGAGSFTL